VNTIVRILIHFFGFGVAMLGLSSIDFNRLLKKNKVWQAQVLYLVLSMVIGYGVAQFLLNIMWNQLQ
jgi:uncharacterized integral membrane protein (TIGR02327 family)